LKIHNERGAGRKPLPENKKGKTTTFYLYPGEEELIREYLKKLREA
jgi:hypothetical protein